MEGTWRASFYAENDLRASVPFIDRRVELERAMGPGTYTVELKSSGAYVSRFTLSVGEFSLPEAFEASRAYIANRQYIRARSVLADAAARYPYNADIHDLLLLAMAIADADPAGLHEEESRFGVVKSRGDTARGLRQTLASAKAKFGQGIGWMFASRNLDRVAIPDEVVKKIVQETASIVVVEVLSVLEKHLELQSARDELMLEALGAINKRLDQFNDLYRSLNSRIDLVRLETAKSDDEKFEEVKEVLRRFGDEIAKRNLRIADYGQFFAGALGQNCWNWLSADVQKIFMESEDHYCHALSRPCGDTPDFTAGLLDLCRGLELLFNERWGAVSIEIARTILRNDSLLLAVGRNSKTLRSDLEEIIRKSDHEKALGISEIVTALQYGKSASNALTANAKDILARCPGPADNEQRALLNLITAEYRNDKMHLHPRSGHKFTDRKEMQALRKLIFGIDDGESKVSLDGVLAGVDRTSWLTERETDQAKEDLKKRWRKFPGVVRILWQGFAQPAATSAAR